MLQPNIIDLRSTQIEPLQARQWFEMNQVCIVDSCTYPLFYIPAVFRQGPVNGAQFLQRRLFDC